jgi:hypothetical protein
MQISRVGFFRQTRSSQGEAFNAPLATQPPRQTTGNLAMLRFFKQLMPSTISRRSGHGPSSKRSFRPLLEALEDRFVPASFSPAQLQQAGEYMRELINTARADPAGTASRFGIDLNEGLAPGTISATPKQPLAPNSALFQAIDSHLEVWLGQFQVPFTKDPHVGLGDGTPPSRATGAGFDNPGSVGENVAFLWSTGDMDLQSSVDQMFQNLFVDSTQPDRGHRINMLNGDFQEIGSSAVAGLVPASSPEAAGANVIQTGQDFGTSASGQSFLSGVAMADGNANGRFDVGEGLAGVAISATTPDGTTLTTTTDASGAYSIQLPASAQNQSLAVTANGGALANQSQTVSVGTSNTEASPFVAPGAAAAAVKEAAPVEAHAVTPSPTGGSFTSAFGPGGSDSSTGHSAEQQSSRDATSGAGAELSHVVSGPGGSEMSHIVSGHGHGRGHHHHQRRHRGHAETHGPHSREAQEGHSSGRRDNSSSQGSMSTSGAEAAHRARRVQRGIRRESRALRAMEMTLMTHDLHSQSGRPSTVPAPGMAEQPRHAGTSPGQVEQIGQPTDAPQASHVQVAGDSVPDSTEGEATTWADAVARSFAQVNQDSTAVDHASESAPTTATAVTAVHAATGADDGDDVSMNPDLESI